MLKQINLAFCIINLERKHLYKKLKKKILLFFFFGEGIKMDLGDIAPYLDFFGEEGI